MILPSPQPSAADPQITADTQNSSQSHTSADSLVFDPDERQPQDDLHLIFEAISTLDDHHQQLARELLEAITHRAAAHRWQQPAAS